MSTPFTKIYDAFFARITDDMYMEWTKEDTEKDCKNILLAAIPGFEFPRFALYDYDADAGVYNVDLTSEEINIFAYLMMMEWVQRQVTTIENTRMKYTGTDFKMTSQANHLDKLMKLKNETERIDRHYQRLYRRHKINDDGTISSNWSVLIEKSALDGN